MKKIARTAGVLYLLIIILAGFSEGYIRSSLIDPGKVVETIKNLTAHAGLFRLGIVFDLIAFMSDAAVAILLYILLKQTNRTISLAATSFRLIAHPAIASINLLTLFFAQSLVNGWPDAAVTDPNQLNSLAMIALDLHHHGYLIGGAFFGVHCLLLGYLLFKSDYFPAVLGILLVLAGAGYLIESFGIFLSPQHASIFKWIVIVPAAIGELSLALWLLIKGIITRQEQTV